MPAQAGIQSPVAIVREPNNLDSRFRGNDGIRKPGKYVTVIAKDATMQTFRPS